MKWSQMKRILSLTLCVLMVLALLPTSTLAEEAATATQTAAPASDPAPVIKEQPASDPAPASDPTPASEASAAGTEAPADAVTPVPVTEATPTPSAEVTDAAEATPTPEISATPTATPKMYVVNFVIDGETDPELQQTVEEGGTVSAPSIPAVPSGETYAGQIFLYWSASHNEAYNFSTPVTSNMVLTAVFGTKADAPDTTEEPIVADEDVLFAAFAMEGGIIPETTPLWTYTFVVNGTAIDTKIVATGDTLDAPAVPDVTTGQEFIGWYTETDTKFDSFGVQTVTADGATTLTAKFTTAYYVFFYNQFGSVVETRTPDASNIVSTANITALQLASDEALLGWSTTSGGTTSVGSSVTVNGANINLYPIIKKVIWITFDSAGGTYISPMYITPGTPLTQTVVNNYIATQNGGSSTITKAGYTFTGWSGYSFGSTPTASVSLTAGWTAATVGYTVLFWQQAVVGSSYAVVAADTVTNRTALAGSTVSPSAADTGKTYKGFDYNATKSTAVTVNGDGSTILNVYYDREIWTINFLLKTKTSANQYSDSNDYTVWNTISGRYGAKLNYWATATQTNAYYSGGTNGFVFSNWMANTAYNGTFLTYLDIYDDGGQILFNNGVLNLYGIYQYGATLRYTINHYRQNLDLSWSASPSLSAYAYNNGSFTINNRFEGFTAYQYQKDGGTWTAVTPGGTSVNNINGTLNIRHTRNSYALTIRNFTTQLSTTSLLYETPLAGYQPAQPSRPSGVPSDYVWAGWYTTQEGYTGSEMIWSQTLPAHDLIVYGVWKEPTFTGIAHSISFGGTGGSTVDLGVIPYGGTISESALAAAQAAAVANKPHPTDTFGGWLIYKNGTLVLFNSSMRIFENVVLYPVWISTASFSITYNLGEATGTAPADTGAYVAGAQAQVKAYTASAVTPPASKVFIGWRSSVDNKIYYPNSALTITENTTLTAVWVYSSIYVTITYNGNGGKTAGGATTFTGGAANNTTHTIQGNSFNYTGKLFVGWNTSDSGSGNWYYPGDNVTLGVSIPTAPGTLYAIWQDQTFDVSVTANPEAGVSAKSGAGTYVYGTNASVTWTLANGYQIMSVTDNGTTVPASSYTGNSYAISGITADHAVVINTQMTLFSLTYNGNGGTAGGNASYSSTKTMGTSFNVDANTFTRAGYYFVGWSTNASATTGEAAYAPGTSVLMPSSNLTLYAVWAAKTAVTLTANSATQNYTGSQRSVSGISASVGGLTIEGTTAGATGTNPGVYATSFTNQAGLVLKSGGVDVTERYTVSWANGSLTINPQVTYRVSANDAVIGSEWVAYGTGDATYSVTPPANVTVSGDKYYWLGTYSPATANDLTANTTIYASYARNKTLVITADSASYAYNGTERAVTTATVNVSGVTVTGYTVSGSGTNVGSYPTSVTLGTVKIMNGSTDVTHQYDVSTAGGTLTITPADMTVTSSGYTGTYDNQPHGISVTPDVAGSEVKYSLTNSTDPADYSSTYPTVTDATAGTTVYFMVTNPNYNPVFDSETIVINKRIVRLTTEGAEQVYNGSALTNPNWTEDSDSEGFVTGQGFATANTTGTITNVGTANNGFEYTLTSATKTGNYTFDVTEGVLKITKANTLSVDATDYSGKYDGSAHGVTAAANVPGGTTIRYSLTNSPDPADYTLTVSPTATHVDDSRKVYFVATNDNYEPAFGDAQITILPRTITLTGATQSETYNGNALTNSTVTIGGDNFLEGEGYATMPTATGTITDAGSVSNPVSGGTLNSSTQAHDYAISSIAGTLTVNPATLTVQANDQQIAFPAGRPATGALTYTLVGGNVSGETPAFGGVLGYDSALAADPLNPGTYTDAIVGGTLALSNSGAFKADNYVLTVLPGDLKVVNGAFTVTLTGGDWTYDGDPHGPTLTGTKTGDTVEYFIPNGSGGWTSTGTTPPTVTNVSDSPLEVKVVVTRPGFDPAESTTTLTITPADMTVTSSGYTGTYDNQPHGISVTPDVAGSEVKYSLTNSTDPADYSSTYPTVTDATAGTTVYFMVTNPNYNPVFDSETIVINKRIVRLTTEGAEQVYNGTALTNPNWAEDTDSEGFVTGQGFATTATTGTITNVGTANNGFEYTLTTATKTGNYTFDVTEGVLKVTKANTLSVDATDYSGKYDGSAHGVTAAANVPGGTTIRYSLTNSPDPADYTLTVSPTATHVDDSRKVYFVATNDNYEPAFGDAQITVTPRTITLTGATQTETYNGNALTNSTVTIGGDNFLEGEGYSILPTATGTITDAGSVNNPVSGGTLNSSTQAHDYAITTQSGTLTVNPATLTVQANDQQIAFPAGRPATGTLTYTLVGGNVSGETPAFGGVLGYDDSLAADPLNPGTYTDAIVGGTLALSNSGAFKADNYVLTVLPGDLKVVNGAFTVTLTGGDWTYDGDPHGPTLTGTKTGDTVEYFIPNGSGGWTSTGTTPPTVTNVSDGPLEVKVVVTRPGYDPAESTTTLTINPADMTVTSSGYTGTYDNQPHGISVTPDVAGSEVKYSLTNSTDPADYSSTYPTVTDATAGTTVYFMVTNPNYNPVFDSETIVINKRIIRLTTEGAEQVYSGTALTNPNWAEDTDSEGFVTGQGFATAATTGTITNVGTANNGFEYTLTTATKTGNYTVDVTEGVLKVTKANTLSVDATDYSGKYDGSAHGVTAAANVPGGTTIRYSLTNSPDPADYTLTVNPTATHVDDSRKVYFVATNDNYEPAFGDAQITILPRTITLTGATQTETYNGNALTNSTVTIGGDNFLEGEGYSILPTATGTITDAGSVANPVSGGTLNSSTQAHDYAISSIAGTLTVNPATLTVQANDQQIAFPAGRPATGALTYTLVGGNVSGETPAFGGVLGYDSALAADPLNPGTYTDAIVGGTLALSNSGAFKADNYALTVLPGDLKVVNGAFTVTLTGGEWTYDGDPHGPTLTGTKTGDTVEYFIPNGSGGWTSTGTTPPTVTNVSDGPLEVKVVVTRPGFDPAESTTTLTITPADMTVTSSGYTGTYDNQPHGISVTPNVAGSEVKYSLTNSTDPADYSSTYPTVTDATPGTTVYFMVTNPNYNPVFDSETIVINKRIIRLTTEGAEQVYNGTALTNPNWAEDTDSEGFVTGQGFATANTTGTITNVGTANNGFSYTLNAATKTGNYTFDVTEGVLKITKANTLSVDATDYSGKYDGSAHGVTAAANVPGGTTIRYSLTNSPDPADYTLNVSPTAKNTSDSKTVYFVAINGNYEPAFGSAEITISPRTVTIDTADGTKVFDGTALKATGWSVNTATDGFVGSEGFATAATTGTITNAGTAENGFVYTLKSATLAENYTISVDPGTLTVTPRTVLIAAADTGKNYGAADPTFAYTVKTGTVGGTTYYPILPADLSGVTVTVSRLGYDSDVGLYPDVLKPNVSAVPSVESNYLFATENADFTINPQVVYKLNTTDAVTGFPPTSWFDLGTDASLATAAGVQRVGYHLVGWEDATTGEQFTLGGTIPAIGANHTLNAVWEIAYSNVLYVPGTPDPVRDMPDNLVKQQYGVTITVSSMTPYHSGYGFLYWKTTSLDGTERTFNPGDTFTMPDQNVVLVAVWEARTSPVYYHDGLASGRTVEQGRYATDSVVTVAGSMFTNPGYKFVGWSLSAGGSVKYQPGSTFTMPPRQVNLYAIWEQQLYTVTYIVNGGTGILDGTTPYATFTGLKTGDATPVPADPTLEGFNFGGWTTLIPATITNGNIVIYGTMTEIGRDVEEIPDAETPLAGPTWALLNLILAIATALASILMLVGYLGKKKEEAEGVTIRETKKHGFMRILTLVPGIGGIIAFILTENMKNPMVFTDRWTLLMILIAVVQLLLVLFGAKQEKDIEWNDGKPQAE